MKARSRSFAAARNRRSISSGVSRSLRFTIGRSRLRRGLLIQLIDAGPITHRYQRLGWHMEIGNRMKGTINQARTRAL